MRKGCSPLRWIPRRFVCRSWIGPVMVLYTAIHSFWTRKGPKSPLLFFLFLLSVLFDLGAAAGAFWRSTVCAMRRHPRVNTHNEACELVNGIIWGALLSPHFTVSADLVIYTTAIVDERMHIFYRFFFLFLSAKTIVHKYDTTVLGNG